MSTPVNPAATPDPYRSTTANDVQRSAAAQPDPEAAPLTRREVVRREKERFGGMKFGADFFGWLTACGTAVLLTALLAAAGTALGLGANLPPVDPANPSTQTIGLVGAIILVAVTFVAYFAGGYVAGRMARFNGAKQGVGVWLWAVIAAVVVAVLTLIAGTRFNILGSLNGFPRIPVNEGTLTSVGLLTAVVVAVVALIAAMLGGLAGMRYHRRIDAVGLEV